MTVRRSRIRGLLFAGVGLCVHPMVTRGDEVASLLRRAPSPGSMALLATRAAEPGVAEKLKAGLTIPEANTRGAAARAVNVAALKDLLPSVAAALSTETDALAAREEIRTLAAGGVTYVDAILQATARFAPKLDRDVVRAVARGQGADAIPFYFGSLRSLTLSDQDRRAFFRLATRGRSDWLVAALAMALGRSDADAWRAVLRVAREGNSQVAPGVMVSALGSTDGTFRSEAVWSMARFYCGRKPANANEILAALAAPTSGASPQAGPAEGSFGTELLGRVLGKDAVENAAWTGWLESGPTQRLDADFDEGPLLNYLTPGEYDVLTRRGFRLGGMADFKGDRRSRQLGTGVPPADLVRLVRGLPNGVASDVFDLESCHSRADMRWFALAVVDFRADGIPRAVRVTNEPPGGSCHRTAETLFEMSVAPDAEGDPSLRPSSYLALFDPDELRCPDALLQPILRVEGEVLAPKLIKRVEPMYPKSARRQGEEGISIYEAVITETGCIRDLRLLKSSTPTLDIMGMEAISRWQYAPATLAGKPVSVYLTVTTTFSLNGTRH